MDISALRSNRKVDSETLRQSAAAPLESCTSRRRRDFKPFCPLALVQQAPPAIILAALCHFGGPALLRGPRPSPCPGAPSWPSGLTLRSSRPAFGGRLTLAVRHHENNRSEAKILAPFMRGRTACCRSGGTHVCFTLLCHRQLPGSRRSLGLRNERM